MERLVRANVYTLPGTYTCTMSWPLRSEESGSVILGEASVKAKHVVVLFASGMGWAVPGIDGADN